jgi:antitoxin MazE
MEIRVQKWGNSLAIRIPKVYADEMNVNQGTLLRINMKDNNLILEPTQKKKKLEALLAKVTDENIHDEIETGNGVGNEAW